MAEGGPPADLAFEAWATERYCLFNPQGGRVDRGDLSHEPWQLERASLLEWEGNFLSLVPGAESFRLVSASYSPLLDVQFQPFERNA